MNNGQSSPSPTIRLITDERLLAVIRGLTLVGLAVIGFFLMRLVSVNDENMRRMDEFRTSIQLQVSEFKIEVAKSTANANAMILALQDRVSAQSRRMDGFDGDIREVNKKLYEGRTR